MLLMLSDHILDAKVVTKVRITFIFYFFGNKKWELAKLC